MTEAGGKRGRLLQQLELLTGSGTHPEGLNARLSFIRL